MNAADVTVALTVAAVILSVGLLVWRHRRRTPIDLTSDRAGDWSTLSEQADEIARRLDITAADARRLAANARHLRAGNRFAADVEQALARQVSQPPDLRHPQRKDVQ